MAVDHLVTVNGIADISPTNITKELAAAVNITDSGAFLGDSNLQVSKSNDRNEVANQLRIEGNIYVIFSK